jgi:hypothetical protein
VGEALEGILESLKRQITNFQCQIKTKIQNFKYFLTFSHLDLIGNLILGF